MKQRWMAVAIAAMAWVAAAGPTSAQNVRYQGASPTDFGTVNVGNAAVLNRTITVASAGETSTLTAVNITGAGFAQVGGTCVPGFTLNNGTPCTLQLRFAPGVAGIANGSLFIKCVSPAVAGGLTIACDGVGSAIGLIGNALLAAVETRAIPTLSPATLTLLALLLFVAMVFTLKRTGTKRIDRP